MIFLESALHYAAHGDHEKIVRYLLQHANAKIDLKAWDGTTAIELASGETHTFMSRWSLEVQRRRRQDIKDISSTKILHPSDGSSITNTSQRSQNVHEKTLRQKTILDSIGTYSPHVDTASSRFRSSMLATSRTSSSARALLSVATMVDAKNESLRRAANNGDIHTVKKLVANGVDCNSCHKLTGWSKYGACSPDICGSLSSN